MREMRAGFDRLDAAIRVLRQTMLQPDAYDEISTAMFTVLREGIYEVEAAAAQLRAASEDLGTVDARSEEPPT